MAGVGAQLADALVDRAQHRLHAAPALLEFAGDAAPSGWPCSSGDCGSPSQADIPAHHFDGLPGRHRQQVEAQVVGDVALEVAITSRACASLPNSLAGGLRQVVQRFLDLARAQRVADVAIALAVALDVAQVALQQGAP